jgi:peptide-methionine (S)-S-oxide reductase
MTNTTRETATLAGGCFWCLEAAYVELKGVEKVVSGYMGGHVPNASYQDVCSGSTGHAEVVQVTFDPSVVSFCDLLDVFFTIHDPTTLDRQGHDVGSQYRSAVFFHGPAQKQATEQAIAELTARKVWPDPIVTQVTAASEFLRAEDYHQDYFARNPDQPYCRSVVAPKVAKLRKLHYERLKV